MKLLKFGIPQKLDETRNKISEGVKNFGERHPTLQNAATKTAEAFSSARNFTSDKLNKIIESETVKNVTGKINNKYNEVINSETMKNIGKKTAEGYHNLKVKTGMATDINNENNIEAQEQKQEEPLINKEELNNEPPKQDE